MPETSWEGGKEQRGFDTVLGGFTSCSTHAASACYAPIPREANSNNFDTYSTAVAFDLLQHCCRGQEAERLLRSPLQHSYPTHQEHWGLLGLLQASATDEPQQDDKVRSAAQTAQGYFDMLPVHSLLCIPPRVLAENG